MILKQSTAYSRKFLMVLSSDHISGATGKTVTVELSKGPGGTGGAAAGAVTEIDSSNLPGVYQVALTTVDTNTIGDLAFHCTASGCDATDFCDQVQATVFTDLLVTSGGRAYINDNILQNTALNGFTFLMVDSSTSFPKTGLSVAAQRSLGGAGFAPCANSVSEVGNGVYTINLAAADLNAPVVMLRFTASGAADLDLQLITTP